MLKTVFETSPGKDNGNTLQQPEAAPAASPKQLAVAIIMYISANQQMITHYRNLVVVNDCDDMFAATRSLLQVAVAGCGRLLR